MSGTIEFEVPGAPVPKARPRVVGGRTYTPKPTKDYERLVRWTGQIAMWDAGCKPLTGPVGAYLAFTLPYPASWSKRKRAANEWAVTRSDLDNLVKAVLDGLNGICYGDDRQVASVLAEQRYGEEPGVRVQVRNLGRRNADESNGEVAGGGAERPGDEGPGRRGG